MMRDKKILWAINCYSRVNHLRAQVELIRRQFGQFFDVLVYTNHLDLEKFPDSSYEHLTDFYHRHDVNTGGHTGCRDAYNYVLSMASGYDYIIWSHADFLIKDYSNVERWMNEMIDDGDVFMCLGQNRQQNPRKPNEGIVPHIYNDFFVLESGFYQEVFPRFDVCDGWLPSGEITDCIEVSLGKWIDEKIGDRGTLIIPCKIDKSGPGDGFTGPLGPVGTRDDEFSKSMLYLATYDRPAFNHLKSFGFASGMLYDKR